jgi:hypothetical protein
MSVSQSAKRISGVRGRASCVEEFLSDLKREITDSTRDLGRRIDHVFHPDRLMCLVTFSMRADLRFNFEFNCLATSSLLRCRLRFLC